MKIKNDNSEKKYNKKKENYIMNMNMNNNN